MPKITFAQRLKELRAAAGLTQAALAERAGLDRFTVAGLEQGRQGPVWETVLALARALGVSVAAFNPEETPAQKQGKKKGKRS